jgi:tetratricopeptide (TPR) repeat protein
MDSVEIVQLYLKGQNLEQVGRGQEAIESYERAVAARFDSTGPYDRLIALYSNRAQHVEVIRVCDAALEHVHTYEEKRAWYERMRAEADRARTEAPKAAPKKQA